MADDKTATQAEDTAIEPKDVQTTAAEQNPPEEAKPEDQDRPKKTAWYTRVIAREAAEKREAKREADILKNQNAMLMEQLASKNPDAKSPALTQAQIDKLADKKAAEIANVREFNRACDKIAEQGNDEFDDFDKSVDTLQSIGGNYADLLHITTEIPEAHRILYHLGQNPDEAEQLLSLPPTKMALAVAKLETKLSKAKEKVISDAPDPITPVKPRASKAFDPNDPQADREEWSKWREKTRRKR